MRLQASLRLLVLLAFLPSCHTAPAPERPAGRRCASDSDCVATVFDREVSAPDECYCPGCPVPRPLSEAAAHERSWQASCGDEWAREAGCARPVCPRPPGAVGCREGECTWVVPPAGL